MNTVTVFFFFLSIYKLTSAHFQNASIQIESSYITYPRFNKFMRFENNFRSLSIASVSPVFHHRVEHDICLLAFCCSVQKGFRGKNEGKIQKWESRVLHVTLNPCLLQQGYVCTERYTSRLTLRWSRYYKTASAQLLT